MTPGEPLKSPSPTQEELRQIERDTVAKLLLENALRRVGEAADRSRTP